MFHLIGFIVFGFLVGLVARALLPGRQHMSLIATTILGIIGSLVAGYVGQAFGWYGPQEAGGFIASTIGAIVLLAIYHVVMSRRAITHKTDARDFPRKVA
jgi:uncharacterized membrane protein YeaQ/YmgE (transglycosylase-associated protein family)